MKIKFTWILSLITITFLISCNSNPTTKNDDLGKRFFENYSSRKDYKKMLSFYNDSLIYENVAQYSGSSTIDPRYLLNEIIRWNDQTMQYENNNLLKVNELFSNDTMIIANGEFSAYSYNGIKFPSMKFTTYLYLDKNSKIKKQVDWFNYPIEDIIELYQLQQGQDKIKLDKQ
ncbi:hypothetical protein [Empedobacter tilapiae]|uniref:Nuclear transport factor 2 family protein n=1 Tax=Empedobacter tilapiae TaxID=2491114 RepID=A0A4Z1B1S1_9FLAO|nr:hypothetical protein [Empedobacter tilapiae]TGN24296.1 hypothetical protein E4J94_13710 [Empedobacter tilapiae]